MAGAAWAMGPWRFNGLVAKEMGVDRWVFNWSEEAHREYGGPRVSFNGAVIPVGPHWYNPRTNKFEEEVSDQDLKDWNDACELVEAGWDLVGDNISNMGGENMVLMRNNDLKRST